MYSQLQPFSRPELSDLKGKRIDVLTSFDIDIKKGIKELRWCQGEVLEVVQGVRDPTVRVKWDAQEDADGYEESTIIDQKLLPSKWRKDKAGAWRMDVEIDVQSDIDNESEDKDEVEEDILNLESESEDAFSD
jgi:hypothetical protein